MKLLKIHFLNVGHGDCTLIEFPSGRKALVDINNSKIIDDETKSELVSEAANYSIHFEGATFHENERIIKNAVKFVDPIDPIDYLEENLTDLSLFRFILTHPDMDHMSGLYNLKEKNIAILNFWDTDNHKEVQESDCKRGGFDYRDWEVYQELRVKSENPKVLKLLKGEERSYFTDDEVKILSPTKEIVNTGNEKSNWNLMSYILLIEYSGHKIILGGDADAEVWDQLAETDSEELKDISVLKASHHGRNSGYSETALEIMKPTWTVCSVGKKPPQDAHNKYRKHTQKKVLSTRFRGNIVVEIESNGELTVYCEENYDSSEDLHKLQ